MRGVAALLALTFAAPAAASLAPRDLAAVGVTAQAGTMLPAALPFAAADGRRTTLGAVAGGRPLVLLFADFTCRHICGAGATLVAASLARTGLRAGADYRLAIVGLDPKDSAADAARFADRLGAQPATILRGSPAAVGAATARLGYAYRYDAAIDQFAHDATLYVFGGDGRLRATLPEIGLAVPALRAALTTPAPLPHESWAAGIAHLCYGFAAAHGRYGRPVVIGLQALSTALLLAAAALFLRRRRRAA